MQNLFATPLWTFKISNSRMLNRKLLIDGMQFSTPGEWEFFNLPGEGITELKQFILESAASAAKDRRIEYKELQIRGRQHVRSPLESDIPHHHPSVDMVGVYYLQTPTNCGDILLHDSRGYVNDYWVDPYVLEENDLKNIAGQSGKVCHRITPEAGKLIIFPNYVTHSVETNLSNDIRISIVLEFRFLQ